MPGLKPFTVPPSARAAVLAAAAVLALTACGQATAPAAARLPAEPPTGEPVESDEEATRPVEAGQVGERPSGDPVEVIEAVEESTPVGPPITLAFGGDVMFEGMVRPQLDADPDGLLAPIAPVLGEADLAVVNLETAITVGGDPAPKQYAFRAPPTGLTALAAAGVDVVSLANNHGMDFGQAGLEDTLAAAEDIGLPVIGAGRDAAAAYAPEVVDVRGRSIAVFGATQVLDSAFLESWTATQDRPGLASVKDAYEDRLVDAIAAARPDVDTVVVYLHWGVEGHHCPSARQQELARRLVDAGADVIVGGHAHRLQGAGMMDGSLVAYGLGNFVFYTADGPGADTGVLTVTVEGREVLEHRWTPARLRGGIPHPLEGDEATTGLAAWEELRGCTGLAG